MAATQLDTIHKTDQAGINLPSLGRADFGAIAILISALVGLFWKVIFASQMFFYRDVCNYTYPTLQLIRDYCHRGILPYWNPYLNYGQPVLGNPNLLFFYPYTLAILTLPFDLAYTLHFVFHFALAAIGTYLLARVWGQSPVAAFLAAFFFVFSGPVLSLGNVYNTVACCAWIPWAILAVDHALKSNRARPWILVVVVFSLQWLAAEPFSMLATFGLAFAYALYYRGSREKLLSKSNLRLVAIFGAIGVAMLLLCAVQLLPGSDLLAHSRRGNGLSFHECSIWSLNPFAILQILTPSFSGSVLSGPPGWQWLISDRNDAYNISDFIGFTPFFFALAGWAIGSDRRRKFVAFAALAVLAIALGHFTPIYALARLVLPPLMVVRFPIKLLVHVTFLVAILAGWGFDALLNVPSSWIAPRARLAMPVRIFLVLTATILGVAWLAPAAITIPASLLIRHINKIPFSTAGIPDYFVDVLRLQFPGLVGFCMAAVLLIFGLEKGKSWARPGLYGLALAAMCMLVMVNVDANPTVPKSFYAYRPPVLDEFKGPEGNYRFISRKPIDQNSDASDTESFVNFQSIPVAAELPGQAQGSFQSRIQLYTGSMYYKVDGSVNLDQERAIPLYLLDFEVYLDSVKPDPLRYSCLVGRSNVKYILTPLPMVSSGTRPIARIFNGSNTQSWLYEDSYFLPRSYVAGTSLFLTNSTETLQRMASPSFDAETTVILDEASGEAPSVAGANPSGRVEFEERQPNSVTLHAQLDRPGYVVLMDRFDSNWLATTDGRAVPVLRANQLFRAVYVDAGEHRIRFFYRQKGLKPGLILSLTCLAALLALWIANPKMNGVTPS